MLIDKIESEINEYVYHRCDNYDNPSDIRYLVMYYFMDNYYDFYDEHQFKDYDFDVEFTYETFERHKELVEIDIDLEEILKDFQEFHVELFI